ncbi:MAG: VCBS repeat-containing protein [Sedimentisphaerales bacterium]|nr:VCBS repeat-containing protein [Sedimentisphaerales bacterium]
MMHRVTPLRILGMGMLSMWPAFLTGCRDHRSVSPPAERQISGPQISAELGAALARFNRAAALLEQYQYEPAAQALEALLARYPDWTAARFNLGLAYFNQMESAQNDQSLEKARECFLRVLQSDPDHRSAHFCLGLYYQHAGQYPDALAHFQAVSRQDDRDCHVLYKLAETYLSLGRQDEGVRCLEQVIEQDPGFISAIYRLAIQYQRDKKPQKARALFERFSALKETELTGGSYTVLKTYGSAGQYYMALGADNLPLPKPASATTRILFSPEVRHIVTGSNHSIELADRSLPTGAAAGDIDNDGTIDLCLAMPGPSAGVYYLLNDGKGHFTPAGEPALSGLVPCLGDVDNDGDLDLWLGCRGPDRYLSNDGTGSFSDEKPPGIEGPSGVTALVRLLDWDSDGDLDLLAVRQNPEPSPTGESGPPASVVLYNNNRDGTFTDKAAELGFRLERFPIGFLLADDFDNDRDQDIMLFAAGAGRPICWVNDRGGGYHLLGVEQTGLDLQGILSATTGDPDKDGDRDILAFTRTGMCLFVNRGGFRFEPDAAFANAHGRLAASGGQFADMDNDGDLDIVIADATRRGGDGGRRRGPALLVNAWPEGRFENLADLDAGSLLEAITWDAPASCIVADFNGDHRCDIVLAPAGAEPVLLENLTKGGNAIQIDLRGMQTRDKKSRSNNSAVGARLEVKTGAVYQQYVVGVPSGPASMAPYRIHAGLGPYTQVDWLRILWPDAVLQAELELGANQVIAIPELQRKTSSCPHLFAWDGEHFAFISDFGGMGGVGYLVAPGQYAPPDPTEYVPVPGLQPREGDYILQVLEPLEEVVYLDEVQLIAVDHPAGTVVYPNEMMAVNAPPPAFELFGYRDVLGPVRAVDHRGVDVTDQLRAVDRRYAGTTQPDHRFMGFAEDHFVQIDFGEALGRVPASARLVLFLHGWVEYGYSSTNYAASQAGQVSRAPTIAVWRNGQWRELFREVGYPAGINHLMTLEVTGKLLPSDRRIRIASNMEIYWDRIFLAPLLDASTFRRQEVPVRHADLHYLGYPREYSPDAAQPNLYDYENIDRAAAWKLMSGDYTRYGEVTELLHAADDRYAIMGRGEEITLCFDAESFGPVPAGHTRTFILKTDSFCKDMDLYSAHPDTVEPLPFHAMSGYPYGPDEHYPADADHQEYRRTYNTRTVLRTME